MIWSCNQELPFSKLSPFLNETFGFWAESDLSAFCGGMWEEAWLRLWKAWFWNWWHQHESRVTNLSWFKPCLCFICSALYWLYVTVLILFTGRSFSSSSAFFFFSSLFSSPASVPLCHFPADRQAKHSLELIRLHLDLLSSRLRFLCTSIKLALLTQPS